MLTTTYNRTFQFMVAIHSPAYPKTQYAKDMQKSRRYALKHQRTFVESQRSSHQDRLVHAHLTINHQRDLLFALPE